MFSSRKAAPPAFDNALQGSSFDDEDDVHVVHRGDQAQAGAPVLPQALAARSLNEPDIMAQTELARQYGNEVTMSRVTPPAPAPAPTPDVDSARLCIGSKIKMKGSVEDCGVLQVDGHFEASAQSNDLKVSESGIFVGDADVHNAEIVGRFEGNLNVKDRLVIRSTGVVTGTVRYGGIAIENGGKITGDIQAILKNEPPAEAAAPEVPAAAEKSETEPAQERKPLRLNLPDSQPDPADTVESEPTTTGA